MKAVTLVLLVLVSGCASNKPEDILKLNMREHTNLALHTHTFLEIEIDGQKQPIPPNIGISEAGMRVIHTHDGTGKLHIESPYPHTFYLKDFFTIWGKPINSTCIFDKCADGNGTWQFFVNGIENHLNLPLKDGDRVQVVYKAK